MGKGGLRKTAEARAWPSALNRWLARLRAACYRSARTPSAYIFTALTLVSAPSAFRTENSLIIVAWIAQTFLQLVLLPIIIVGQNVQAAAADARAQATFNDAAAVLEEAKQIQARLAAQDAEIGKILAALTAPRAV